LRVKKELLF
jgi:hypothetical protein